MVHSSLKNSGLAAWFKVVQVQRVMLMILAIIGIGVASYPAAASWLTDRAQQSQIDAYARHVEENDSVELQAALKAAKAYNKTLPSGPLRDPYSTSIVPPDATFSSYSKQMRVSGTDVMGQLNVPSANINLPIYHGTDASSLDRGVGHLFGSSLPIGGKGTHSALTGHSGLPNGAMFTSLHDVKKGDIFSTSALGKTAYYRVDQISVVLPEETSKLALDRDKDYVTLITCTPVNVNTHRLLIRGERIPAPAEKSELVSAASQNSFPWWIFLPLIVLGGVSAVLFWPKRQAADEKVSLETKKSGAHGSRSTFDREDGSFKKDLESAR